MNTNETKEDNSTIYVVTSFDCSVCQKPIHSILARSNESILEDVVCLHCGKTHKVEYKDKEV